MCVRTNRGGSFVIRHCTSAVTQIGILGKLAANKKSIGLSNIAYPTLAVGINDGIHGTHRAVH